MTVVKEIKSATGQGLLLPYRPEASRTPSKPPGCSADERQPHRQEKRDTRQEMQRADNGGREEGNLPFLSISVPDNVTDGTRPQRPVLARPGTGRTGGQPGRQKEYRNALGGQRVAGSESPSGGNS